MKYICEFHCHTNKSYDGFTSFRTLLIECIRKNINIVSVTDHDKVNISDKEIKRFKKHNIHLIKGCEYTLSDGSHLIGLFVEKAKQNMTLFECTNFILNQGGLIYIPHPYKHSTGLFKNNSFTTDDFSYMLKNATFIELYNGGHDSGIFALDVKKLAKINNLCMVGGSDSHKPWHVGYYTNSFTSSSPISKDLFSKIEMNIHSALERSSTREKELRVIEGSIRSSPIYQFLVATIPYSVKKPLKYCTYFYKYHKYKKIYFNKSIITPFES